MEPFEKKVRASFGKQLFMRTLGAELISVERGATLIRVPFDQRLTQQNGFLHAGVLTSVLDSGCGYAALSVAPEDCEVLSVEFKVNLLAPAVGDYFLSRAAVKRAGKKITVCTADGFAVKNGEERLVATMMATMMNMPDAG